MLKEEFWTRRTIAEVTMLKRYKLLEEIQRNNTREHEVEQQLNKENSLVWEQNRIIYIEG